MLLRELGIITYLVLFFMLPASNLMGTADTYLDEKRSLGNDQIQRAVVSIKSDNPDTKLILELLHKGVKNSPSNLDGRIALSVLYSNVIQNYAIASDILWEGIRYWEDGNTAYLIQTIQALIVSNRHEELFELADKYLRPHNTEQNHHLAYGLAFAYYISGNFDEAERALGKYGIANSIQGILLRAEIHWERNEKSVSIDLLEALYSAQPNYPALLLKLCQYQRETGNFDDSRRYGLLLVMQQPSDHDFRLNLMHTYQKSGDLAALNRETGNMLKQFGGNEVAMRGLAYFASRYANISLIHEVYETALANGFSMAVFTYFLVETYVSAGDYAGALENLEVLSKEDPKWLADVPQTILGIKAVALCGLNGSGSADELLEDFFKLEGYSKNTYIQIYEKFLSINCPREAGMVLGKASELFPADIEIYKRKFDI